MKIVVDMEWDYGRLVIAMTDNRKDLAPPVDFMPSGRLSSHTARGFFYEVSYVC